MSVALFDVNAPVQKFNLIEYICVYLDFFALSRTIDVLENSGKRIGIGWSTCTQIPSIPYAPQLRPLQNPDSIYM